MKKWFLTALLFSFIVGCLQAQFIEKNAFYFEAGASLGTHLGASVSFNYTYNQKYSFAVGWSQLLRASKNKPDDYSSGLVGVFLLNLIKPLEETTLYDLQAGRIIVLNKSGSIRLNFMGGVGFVQIKDAYNFEPVDNSFLVENYTYDYVSSTSVGLLLTPRIEFTTRFYGLSISPQFIYNKEKLYFGLAINHMVGILRPKSN
ncbi:hypothetical protein [Leeuwenhoekiella sp. NPDC079379]|uniref:hypothetical protein n=1 Tax=Leeuwenhoekiella sp. NPDC079379 TaxID=3364122 RepID=UPI0037CC9999